MAQYVSIIITAQGDFIKEVATIRNSVAALNKDLTEYTGKLKALNKQEDELKVKLDKANTALKEAEKRFLETGDAAEKFNLELANAKYEDIRENLRLISEQAKIAEENLKNMAAAAGEANTGSREHPDLSGETGNTEGETGGTEGENEGVNLSGIIKTPMASKTAGNTGGGDGTDKESLFGNALSYGVTGATTALGLVSTSVTAAAVAPAAIAAAIGLTVGVIKTGIDNLTQRYAEKDNAFNDYVRDQFEKATEEITNSLANGITLELAENTPATQDFVEAINTLNDQRNQTDSTMAEAYMKERTPAVQAEADWYQSDAGEAYDGMMSAIGTWEAHLDSLSEQYARDIRNYVLTGEESILKDDRFEAVKGNLVSLKGQYEGAKRSFDGGNVSAGATLGRVLGEIEALAQDVFNASPDAMAEKDANEKLISNMAEYAAQDENFWNEQYQYDQKISEGIAAAKSFSLHDLIFGKDVDEQAEFEEDMQNIKNDDTMRWDAATDNSLHWDAIAKKAFGLNYIPYDNFPAILHEGERVLTASEARAADNMVPSVIISGNSFTVREEADIDKIARQLVRQISKAYMLAG